MIEDWPDKPHALLTDLDGSLVKHLGTLDEILAAETLTVLPGVIEKLTAWRERGNVIVITTGRPQWARGITLRQLEGSGLLYDQLLMDIGSGRRVLLNDRKPWSEAPTAIGITVERDAGLEGVEL